MWGVLEFGVGSLRTSINSLLPSVICNFLYIEDTKLRMVFAPSLPPPARADGSSDKRRQTGTRTAVYGTSGTLSWSYFPATRAPQIYTIFKFTKCMKHFLCTDAAFLFLPNSFCLLSFLFFLSLSLFYFPFISLFLSCCFYPMPFYLCSYISSFFVFSGPNKHTQVALHSLLFYI